LQQNELATNFNVSHEILALCYVSPATNFYAPFTDIDINYNLSKKCGKIIYRQRKSMPCIWFRWICLEGVHPCL